MIRLPDRSTFVPGAETLWFSSSGMHIGPLRIDPHNLSQVLKSRSGAHDRFEALLAIAFGNRLAPPHYEAIVAAAESSCRGDQALANIRLIQSRLVPIADADALAERLMQADRRLTEDWGPDDSELACHKRCRTMEKYDINQPRVPAGNGRKSGEFGAGDGSPTATPVTSDVPMRVISAAVALRAVSSPSFLAPNVAAEALAALGTFAAEVGAAAVFGTIFVPSPNDTSLDGKLPGNDGLTYHYDADESVLQLRDAAGVVVAAGPPATVPASSTMLIRASLSAGTSVVRSSLSRLLWLPRVVIQKISR